MILPQFISCYPTLELRRSRASKVTYLDFHGALYGAVIRRVNFKIINTMPMDQDDFSRSGPSLEISGVLQLLRQVPLAWRGG